ncbi:phospho-sugar mutase [Lactiplantibacillus plantarum]|uniref:phospho-sugar mutase n=1 Tax=Lactiplantibacillus plantarum TaxID=1590 RepID=UPI0007BBDFBB|nr:phospho-sugar mutase [Lactiplantibacillus plantarum]AYE59591.1 phospho-sugar mutase [Lactiplantibacillus plantarum]KZU48699.1 Phosphoglucosamine mutase [Lactiplantibacillus plantarum]MCG0731426.1 Phosphoglucomutase [Lactiplantibacillus plantarum]QBJ54657.1 phospho-sugar mutase [Lactiplantibacillus plantarum]RDG27620.1 phospho-sugar mutase [Lactiplantibacillus plantarum]
MSWQDTYNTWKNQATLETSLKQELAGMADDDAALEDAFYEPMEFGTAGMRGVLGPGINRMNIYTVRQATEGLARFMDTLPAEVKERGVAISFDSRHHSEDFAHESARVLGQHGIKSYVFESLRPTPELSFTVRHLHTYAGIMITASHNPKQYNGYKIYGEDGGQMPPKESDLITSYIRKVDDVFAIAVADEQQLLADKTETIIGDDVDQDYLAKVKEVTINQKLVDEVGKDMKLVFTPLHGTGRMLGEKALKNAGFKNFSVVKEQAVADPEFSTVKFPNPEFPEAFKMAIDLGKKEGADVLIAVDPDADRLGTAVRQPNGEYVLLTGNQIAAVLLHYILQANKDAGTLPTNAAAVKSIVSSEFATKVAASYGVTMINVLTGFKYIAEQIEHFEATGEHTYMFGFEESYGYLIKPFVHDKDAIQTTVLLAEVAAYYKQQGKNLYDGLQDLFKEYGYFREQTTSEEFDGVGGSDKIAALMTKFRSEAPIAFAGYDVTGTEDFQSQTESFADGHTAPIALPKANVLKYHLNDGTWIAIRPSGTEPKIKFYIGTLGSTLEEANDKLAKFEDAIQAFIKE